MSFLKRAETGQFTAAMPCHSRAMAWHGPATTPATSHFGAFRTLKNGGQKGSSSAVLPKCQFWQLNQRLAPICSLLREVWLNPDASLRAGRHLSGLATTSLEHCKFRTPRRAATCSGISLVTRFRPLARFAGLTRFPKHALARAEQASDQARDRGAYGIARCRYPSPHVPWRVARRRCRAAGPTTAG